MKLQFKKVVSVLLMAIMVLSMSVTAFANESTTTVSTAYKDLSGKTEIYAVTETAGSDYVFYNAKNEPNGGVYYGRTAQGGTLPTGRYGLINGDYIKNESMVSFYYSLTDSYSLEYWSYLFGDMIRDGKHGFLVYINFNNEGADCAPVINGTYDAKIIETLKYLNTLSCPVFLRIAGEVNVWSTPATPKNYIAAYRHIATLARTYAPKVACVYSPNYSSGYLVDMDSFYPGDAYVDWIGCSLYYNRYHHSLTGQDAFLGVGAYGDPLLNVQQTVNLSNLHKKPVIITEGGSANSYNGVDNSAWAADRMARAYSYLPMVYPQIKAIVSSDYGNNWEKTDYTFYDNATVTAAYEKAINSNPTLVSSCKDKGSYYTKLSSYTGKWEGKITLAAYTYSDVKPTASWYIDGKWITMSTEYPYSFVLDTSTLSAGNHTIEVKFSNGASKAYTISTGTKYTASKTNDKLYVDGALKSPAVYKIEGSNYFNLRDVAALLNGTAKQFEVGYNSSTNSVTVTTNKPYTMTGTELTGAGANSATATASNNSIYVNGQKLDLQVYKINGSNYFKLRDLGKAINFYVGYENGNITISSGSSYAQ